jgi:hypothetical protein
LFAPNERNEYSKATTTATTTTTTTTKSYKLKATNKQIFNKNALGLFYYLCPFFVATSS